MSATANKAKKAVHNYFRDHGIGTEDHRKKALIKEILKLATHCRSGQYGQGECTDEMSFILEEFYGLSGNGERAAVSDLLENIIENGGRLNGDLHNK